MLYDIKLKGEVWEIVNYYYVTLEYMLMSAKNGTDPLFLVVEQGARKF